MAEMCEERTEHAGSGPCEAPTIEQEPLEASEGRSRGCVILRCVGRDTMSRNVQTLSV